MEKCEISIIIPLYNGEKYIARCISSIIESCSTLKYEIIVIDDGSSDNGRNIVEILGEKNNKIRLISQENKGASSARNLGITNSCGEYIYFMDCDDYILPNALKDCMSILLLSNADMLHFNFKITHIDEKRDVRMIMPYQKPDKVQALNYKNYLESEVVNKGDFSPCTIIIRKSFLINNNLFFDERLRGEEDLIFILELLHKKPKIINIDNTYYIYALNSNSHTMRKDYKHLKAFNDNSINVLIRLNDLLSKKYNNLIKDIYDGLWELQDTRTFRTIINMIKLNYSHKMTKAILNDLKNRGIYPMRHFPKTPVYSYNNSLRFKISWYLLKQKFIVISVAKISNVFRNTYK